MTPYEKNLAAHRRISMLRILSDTGGSANESILKDALEDLGLSAALTRQAVRDDLTFLEECGAIKQTWHGDRLVVAQITERGVDIAHGRAFVEGIKPPSIGV